MYYSDQLIEEIRSRNDIVDVISAHVKLNKKGSTYFGLCPFHNEKSPSFSVTPSKQMYYCFGCGQGGNVFTFVMKYENMNFVEAVKYLADRAGIKLPEGEMSREQRQQMDLKSRLLEINKEAAVYYHHLLKSSKGKKAYEYLKKRGLTDDTITKFGLGYSSMYANDLYEYLKKRGYGDNELKESGLFSFSEKGVYDKFNNRVMFPIMDINSRVIGFGGRVMGDGKPKYLNSPETILFDKSRNLYGMNIARSSRKDYMLICEGYMDVIALHQAGFDCAVASLGTAYTDKQAMLMKRYTDKVYLTFDSDGAGVNAALRAIPMLRDVGLAMKVVNMRPYKDPDEFIKALGAEEYEKRIVDARDSFLYETDRLRENVNPKDPKQLSDFYNQVARKILEIDNELERNVYIKACIEEYNIPEKEFIHTINSISLTYKRKEKKWDDSGKNKKISGDSGAKAAQKTLMTWIVDEPGLYEKIKNIIKKDDFFEEPFRKVADILFSQISEGKINPSEIISRFQSEQEQSEVAGLFNSVLRGEISREERNKAFNDAVIAVKKSSLEHRLKCAKDPGQIQEIITEQLNLSRINIVLD